MRSSDLAFQDWVARAKAVTVASVVAARNLRLRGGNNKSGPCPACGGKDRFTVSVRKNTFWCRGCQRGGDAIELVELMDACSFITACEILTGEPAPKGKGSGIDREELERRAAERERIAQAAAREKAAQDRRSIARAKAIWDEGVPVQDGCHVDLYLRGRRLALPEGARVRMHGALPYYVELEGGERALVGRYPAMIAAVGGLDSGFRAVHITYLERCESGYRKARLKHPETGEALPAKKMRGLFWRSLAFLGGNAKATTLVVGEGIETTLSVYMALPEAWRDRWCFAAALSLDNLAALSLPDRIKQVVLLMDGDSHPDTTRAVIDRAIDAYTTANRTVRVVKPAAGTDFNDMLMERAHG